MKNKINNYVSKHSNLINKYKIEENKKTKLKRKRINKKILLKDNI